ncbi:MAG: hypothetical protein AAF089_10800 [Bacteroidota bacterium]
MPDWYEVFDNEQALVQTRERVGQLTIGTSLLAGAVVSFAPLVVLHFDHGLVWAGLMAAVLAAALGWAALDYLHQRCVVWCVKLSMQHVIGYDFARRTLELDWTNVARVELDAEGLLLVGEPSEKPLPTVLKIPHSYPAFATLSHRIVEYAEAHHVPVHVDGQPLETLDVDSIFGVRD